MAKRKYQKRTNYAIKLVLHRLKIASLILLAIIFLGFSYWFIFFSRFFQINEIKIDKELDISPKIEKDIRDFLSKKTTKFIPSFIDKVLPQYANKKYNILFLSKKELETYLKNKYPVIEDISFKLNLKDNTLLVNLKTREINFLVCYKTECFFADKNGIIFAQAPQISGSLINTIFLENDDLKIGEQIFNANEIKMFNDIFAINKNEKYVFKVKNIEISNPSSLNITINTLNGWQLIISFNSDLDTINTVIQGLFDDTLSNLKNNQEKIEYIDMSDYPQIRYLLR